MRSLDMLRRPGHRRVYDLTGGAWEWCATETTPSHYVLKGPVFTGPFVMAEASAANDASETMNDDDTGFRCVVSGPITPNSK